MFYIYEVSRPFINDYTRIFTNASLPHLNSAVKIIISPQSSCGAFREENTTDTFYRADDSSQKLASMMENIISYPGIRVYYRTEGRIPNLPSIDNKVSCQQFPAQQTLYLIFGGSNEYTSLRLCFEGNISIVDTPEMALSGDYSKGYVQGFYCHSPILCSL